LHAWPNFFIVGAPKAGTTSLYEYLKKIPGVYMSSVKEPNYFSEVPSGGFKIENEKDYLDLFKDVKDEKVIGEASTTYLSSSQTANRIYKTIPNAKIIIILRDPVEQFFSGHLMLESQGLQKLTFHERIQTELKNNNTPKEQVNGFFEQVKRYLDIFGRNQVKVLIFEEFIQNKRNTVNEVLRFLNVNYTIKNFEGKTHNPYEEQNIPRGKFFEYVVKSGLAGKIAKKIPIIPLSSTISFGERILKKKYFQSKPSMSKEDRDFLVRYFQEDVNKLQSILNRKLPWPNFINKI